jgi:nucleoside-diphosphate-sugar epimerase
MSDRILVIGYGPVGAATAERLAARGRQVVVAQRKRPATLPEAIPFVACDVERRDSLRVAARGAAQIVLAVGLPYSGVLWREMWPRIVDNVVETAAETGARVVFVDNLYMYGPQTEPLVETMALTDHPSLKPAARVAATRIWQAASATGRIRFAAVRGPDFYGPGVGQAILGETSLGALAQGRPAMWIYDAETPHDFAYVPDYARGVVSLLDAPDDAFGQAWHVPSAPTRKPAELLALAAKSLGVPLRIRNVPFWAMRALGVFKPEMAEFAAMSFQWDRPYRVDASKFAARFWSDPTPFEEGVPRAALSFRRRAAA